MPNMLITIFALWKIDSIHESHTGYNLMPDWIWKLKQNVKQFQRTDGLFWSQYYPKTIENQQDRRIMKPEGVYGDAGQNLVPKFMNFQNPYNIFEKEKRWWCKKNRPKGRA